MLTIRNLELHVAHSCNLACESCSHYSNQGHKGLLALDEAERWFALWSHRLLPLEFSLLGGEPTIHPRLAEFVMLSRACWPQSRLRLVTNGFLLERHPELPKRLAEAGNARLIVSIHHASAAYRARLEPVMTLLRRWVDDHGISIGFYRSYEQWTWRYNGAGAAMEPFDDRSPRASWEQCPAKFCPQLFEGKIWKCAPLAYLGMQDAKYGLSANWRPYLDYRPLDPGCPASEMLEFFSRQEESHCAMCPAAPQRFTLPLPYLALPASA